MNMVPSNRRHLRADAAGGAILHLWLRATDRESPARLSVTGHPEVIEPGMAEFVFHSLPVAGQIDLVWTQDDTDLSLAYLYDPENVGLQGIDVLAMSAACQPPDQPHSYHFRPPFGWMNDPNGFNRIHGLGHLFYQHYPHDRRWNSMHWGHAVSDDLLHWRHLPVFLHPMAGLAESRKKGGIFSGSAIAHGDGLRVFFTDHWDDRQPEQEVQLTAVSPDGIHVGQPEVILPDRPKGLNLTRDFRDPYVLKGPDGRWRMLLGSRDRSAGVVLIYETDDPSGAGGWRLIGPLFRETRFGMTAVECPCLFPVDGPADDPLTRWVLIFCLLTSRDPGTGRRNLATATVGHFDGQTFIPEFEQELDFGTDAYAFQAMMEPDGPVGIAWLANWTDVSKSADFPTAMTLPRRIVLDGAALRTPPIAAVEKLRRSLLDLCDDGTALTIDLGNGAVEIEFTLIASGTAFDLELTTDAPGLTLALRQGPDGLEIVHVPPDDAHPPRYLARGARAQTLRIFLDAGSVEVFADDGRWTGTKRLAGLATPQHARLTASKGAILACRAYALAL
jgi:beta-fructofuranosidase